MAKTIAASVGTLEQDLSAVVDGEVRFDDGTRGAYSTDGSNFRQVPIGVVLPRTVDAAVAAVAVCRSHDVPVLSRGGGTSLAGQCTNTAVVIDWSKYCHRVFDVDREQRTCVVEPGIVLDTLNDELKESGLRFGPEPATHMNCTIGGMIGNNSCGATAQRTGKVVDNIAALEVLLYDGTRFWCGPTSDEEYAAIERRGDQRARVYRRLRDLRDSYARQIRQKYPGIPRRVSGYNLDSLLPEYGFDVSAAGAATPSRTRSTCAWPARGARPTARPMSTWRLTRPSSSPTTSRAVRGGDRVLTSRSAGCPRPRAPCRGCGWRRWSTRSRTPRCCTAPPRSPAAWKTGRSRCSPARRLRSGTRGAEPVCCGLTWISTGQLTTGKRMLHQAVAALAPHVRSGGYVVGLEPSCTAVFRGDAAELFPDDQDVARLRDHTLTLAELLTEHTPGWEPPALRRPVLAQVHCHQHAVLDWAAEAKLLAAADARAEHLETGCCGLAGNFGFEAGHGEVSRACAERALLPRLREAPDGAVILADGFSCRTQIHELDSGGREAMHLAELLATAGNLSYSRPEVAAAPRPVPPRPAAKAAALAGAAGAAGTLAAAVALWNLRR